MSDIETNDADRVLDQHLAALQKTEIQPGPSPQILAQTLELLERGPAAIRPLMRERWNHLLEILVMLSRQPLVRTAAVAVVCVVAYLLLLSPFSASVAFADVASKLKEARTLTYTMTAKIAPAQTVVNKVYIGEQGQMRTEMGEQSVMIRNGTDSIALFPQNHTATKFNVAGQPPAAGFSGATMLESLRRLGAGDAKQIGEKTIDGVAVKGFSTTFASQPATIWADAKTADPVRIEWTMTAGGKEVAMTMSDFKLDVPLDASLFSLDVPAGYTATTQTVEVPKFGKLEDDVAKLLGAYAKLTGHFPDNLTDWSAFITASTHADEATRKQVLMDVGFLSGRLFSLPNGYTYAGKGVQFGAKETVVFWLKPDTGADSTRGVYGDLRVGEVAVASLPATQPAK